MLSGAALEMSFANDVVRIEAWSEVPVIVFVKILSLGLCECLIIDYGSGTGVYRPVFESR